MRHLNIPSSARGSTSAYALHALFVLVLASLWSCTGEPAATDGAEQADPSEVVSPLLVILGPERTGIHFVNKVIEDDSAHYFIYRNAYSSGGVATGDLDNDGRPDIVFISNRNGGAIYRNLGDLKFEDVSSSSGFSLNGLWAQGVSLVDADADGLLDIYVCASGPARWPARYRRNRLYMNKGGLKFVDEATERGLADEGHNETSCFGDLDGDGDLDLFLLGHRIDFETLRGAITDPRFLPVPEQTDRLYLNDGTGHFTDHTAEAGLMSRNFAWGAAIGDLNGDGRPDIFTSCDFYSPDRMMINDGTKARGSVPHFTNESKERLRHISYFAMGVDRADFNNDGIVDLFEVDMALSDHRLSKENMASMRPTQFWNMVKNDMNHQYMVNALHMGLGHGQFAEIAQAAGIDKTDWSWAPLFVDLDNDGWKDLHITNGIPRDIGNVDFNDAVNRMFNEQEVRPTYRQVLDMAPKHYKEMMVFRNKGDLTFEKAADPWNYHNASTATGASYADLDGDGDMDLVTADVDVPCKVIENRARQMNAARYLQLVLKGGANNPNAIGSSVTISHAGSKQLFELWLGRGLQSSMEPLVHFGLGDATVDSVTIDWYDGTRSVIVAPSIDQRLAVNMSDARPRPKAPDITPLFADRSSILRSIPAHVENPFDDFQKEPLLPQSQSQHGPACAVADVNGDGLDDLIVTGAVGSSAALYVQDAGGRFSKAPSQPWSAFSGSEFIGAHFFDADGDNDPDLYLAAGSTEFGPGAPAFQDRLFINEGRGYFVESKGALPEFLESTECVRSEDVDGDGDLDLFVGGRNVPGFYPFSPKSHVLLNDKGRFTDASDAWLPNAHGLGMITGAQFGDLDGDRTNELVLTAEWMPIRVFKNDGKHFTEISATVLDSTLIGWWQGLALEDIDGDGDLDILAGNLGMNNKFHPTKEHPLKVYSGDLDASGTNDIVLAKTTDNSELPVRGRECSSQQCPVILDKFPTYKAFAEADLERIYGPERLKNAVQYAATEFKSVILSNDGKGSFTASFLPNAAQLFPIRDFVVADFNGDGKKDMVVAGNMYGAEVETVRYDAGVGMLLLGDGELRFTPRSVQQSGIFAPYDTRHVLPIRVGADHAPGILFVNNNGPVQLFLPSAVRKATFSMLR